MGAEDLVRALRREGLPVQKIQQSKVLDEVAAMLNYADLNALKAAVGENHVSAKSVAERVRKVLEDVEPDREEQLPVTGRKPRQSRSRYASR